MIVDVSKHQGIIGFGKLKSKADGVIIRCAYGSSQDVKFEENVNKARISGLNYGAYVFGTWHYSDKSNPAQTAIDQANKVIEILKGKDIKGYVALDLELEVGKETVLSKQGMTDIANSYMDILSGAGYRPVLYCSISWLFDKMIPEQIKYPLWIAYYNNDGFKSSDFPQGDYGDLMRTIKDKVVLWQFTSKGSGSDYGAASKYIDLNHCYGDFVPIIETDPQPSPVQVTNCDPNVQAQQQKLNRLHIGTPLVEDGIKGPLTTNAIKLFQHICGISEDGVWGNQTESAYREINNKPELIKGSQGIAVRYLQYRIGAEIDGNFGNKTFALVKKYQKNNKLDKDGVVGPQTWGALF